MKHILIVFTFTCLVFTAFAQDRHFSQFYASPMTVNPALTGAFPGKFRVGSIYRDQWRGALEHPFSTFAASMDVKFEISQINGFDDALAVGVLFLNDQVSVVDYSNNQMAFSVAYHKALDRESNQYLSVGFKLGFAQRNLNYATLTFEDQFNGVNGYTGLTSEELPENNFPYADFGTGVYYTTTLDSDITLYGGAAIHHFNTPNVSYYKRDEEINGSFKLPTKYVVHAGARIPLDNEMQLFPKVSFMKQAQHLEINVGSNIRLPTEVYGVAMHFGLWGRPIRNYNKFSLSSITALAGLEYQNVVLGLSYDTDINSVANYSSLHGAFEISLMYVGQYENETIACPTF